MYSSHLCVEYNEFSGGDILVPKLYTTFYDKRVFTLDEAATHFPDKQQAANAIHYMRQHNYLKQIKAGLYCVIPFGSRDKDYLPDLVLVGSRLVEPYFFSHYTALRIYGFLDTPLHKIVITSPKRFRKFSFEGRTFQHVQTMHFDPSAYKTITYKENLDVNISNLERTFLDCINRFELAGSMIIFYRIISSFTFLNYLLLMEYLEQIGNKTLMAKVGFTLDYFSNQLNPPPEILESLKSKISGNTTYYLDRPKHKDMSELDRQALKGMNELIPSWNLIIPKSFHDLVKRP